MEIVITCQDPLGKETSAKVKLEVVPNAAYFINIALRLLTPITALTGLLKNKAEIYRLLCKKKYVHRHKKVTKVGSKFSY